MNYLQNAQDKINNFAEDNSDLAKEFAAKLGQQLHNLFNGEWDSKNDIETIIFGENDVLEQTCSEHGIDTNNGEGETDFDWHEARDLQHMVMNAVVEFQDLA